jgi:hypothetical protein
MLQSSMYLMPPSDAQWFEYLCSSSRAGLDVILPYQVKVR